MPATFAQGIADWAAEQLGGRWAPRVPVLSQSVVTVHIECDSVRFLAAKQNRVIEWGLEPLPAGLVHDGVISDPRAVGARIEALLSGHRAVGGRLVLGLSAQRSMPRFLQFPPLAGSMLEEAVRREIKRDAPMPLEEMHLAWQTLEPEAGQTRVFALAVPLDAIEQHLAALKAANRRPQAIDSKPLALVRAVGRADALIADLEPDSIDVVVVRRCVPVITRTVGLRPDDSTQDRVRRLGEELTRTVKFYTDTHREDQLPFSTPVFLTGSLAQEVAAAGVVEASVAYQVESLAPPVECPVGLPLATYMVNIGLALKES
ncbi:MAG: pilus assembly protein PilM [Dehalococcoidia bacterium]